jgi:propionyl-CoA carboxylase beta chain|tara:strand:- start:2345 stop:3901 length:1557 start_codon:yes stop_codon:yes gene_type:complete
MDKTMAAAIKRYHDLQEKNLLGGGIEHIERQHGRGKLTARERIDVLADPGTFSEQGSVVGTTSARMDGRAAVAPCDGAVVGTVKVHGRLTMVYAPDFTVLGGSMGSQHGFKYCRSLEMAAKWGIPMVILSDSSGGRLGYSDVGGGGYDVVFRLQSIFSGVVPQITVLMGPCIAGGAYTPTLCDFLLMSRISANMWIGGPRQTAASTGEKIDKEIGSADYHMKFTGTADIVEDDDEVSIKRCRELLRYLPQNYREKPPRWEESNEPDRNVDSLMDIVPSDFDKSYDMHDVIEQLVDDGNYLEIKNEYAKNLITCFCRFDGEVVGLVANNPAEPGSMLEVNSCDKYYRFLQALDGYNIPLVNIVDTPPVVPGREEEARGALRHIGKITDVYATTTVPKISVVLREAYADAGSMIMGGGKSMGTDVIYCWPTARFAIEASTVDYREAYGMGIEDDAYDAYLNRAREKVDAFDTAHAWTSQMVDDMILPGDTRKKIIEALQVTRNKDEQLPARSKAHSSPPT